MVLDTNTTFEKERWTIQSISLAPSMCFPIENFVHTEFLHLRSLWIFHSQIHLRNHGYHCPICLVTRWKLCSSSMVCGPHAIWSPSNVYKYTPYIILFKFSSLVICSMRYMWSSCFKWWFYLFKSILPRKISNLCSLVLQFLINALVAQAIEAQKVKDLRVLASVVSTWMRPCWGIFPEHLCIHFQTHDYCISWVVR